MKVGEKLYCHNNTSVELTIGKYYEIKIILNEKKFIIFDDYNNELLFFNDFNYCTRANLEKYTFWFKTETDLRIDKIKTLKEFICLK